MSLRILACYLFVLGFSIYAWRNWFISLCAAIMLMAVLQHPDMPKSIGGIQGLNPWNILMLNVLLAWASNRREQGLVWDLPGHVTFLLCLYLLMVMISPLRLILDPSGLEDFEIGYAISEYFINCLKWVLVGLLLYDGCRSRQQVNLALASILLLYLLLSIQVIRWVPWGTALSGSSINSRAYKLVQNEIGYNRVTLSMMLSGASWAFLAILPLAKTRLQRLAVLAAAVVVAFGQALTGGRSGYLSWGAVGVVLGIVKWRLLLAYMAAVVLAVVLFLPGVQDRLLQGFGGQTGNIVVQNDEYAMTSGRNLAWPLVIDKIKENPVFGYGREAMTTTGIFGRLMSELDEAFPHPHNAYLEVLLDNGIIGFLMVIPFYLVVLWHALRLLLDRTDPLSAAAGGVAAAIVLALLVASMGGQTFYPREGSVGMWAAIGLMLRVSVERRRSLETGLPLFSDSEEDGEAAIDADPEVTLESS